MVSSVSGSDKDFISVSDTWEVPFLKGGHPVGLFGFPSKFHPRRGRMRPMRLAKFFGIAMLVVAFYGCGGGSGTDSGGKSNSRKEGDVAERGGRWFKRNLSHPCFLDQENGARLGYLGIYWAPLSG